MKNVAKRPAISLPYLERLISPLVAAGIIRSVRGARGGVSLIKHPKEIRLSEIVQILEGPIAPVDCINNPEICSRSDLCVTHDLWAEMKEGIYEVLESATLQDLVERQKQKYNIGKLEDQEGQCGRSSFMEEEE